MISVCYRKEFKARLADATDLFGYRAGGGNYPRERDPLSDKPTRGFALLPAGNQHCRDVRIEARHRKESANGMVASLAFLK
jgi:hypothetical protein